MRPSWWLLLLLLSLLVSDLSPHGDGDRVMENYSWSLYGKLLHNGRMTPRGWEILQTQNEHQCMCVQRNRVYVVVQDKQRTSSFYILRNDHGGSLSHQEFPGSIHGNHIPAPVVFLLRGDGKSVPAFLMKSDTLPALLVIGEIEPESSHAAKVLIKDHPDGGSAWLLHHRTVAPGHNFQAFSLEKSKNWAPHAVVHEQKMLIKRCCAATSVIISKQLQEIRQKAGKSQAMDVKVPVEYDGRRPSKVRQNTFHAQILHSGTASTKTSDIPLLEIQRNAVKIIQKEEHLNLDKGSLLHRQASLKALSSVHDDDDGFSTKRQRSLVPRETESVNRLKYKMRAAQDDNKEDFGGKIITKQAEFRRPEGESETERSRTNTIENGNQERLAYIRQEFTHKADNNDVDRKQMLTEVGEEVLIVFFLPDRERETQTEPLLRIKLGWKTVNIPIKELDDPPLRTKVMKENFIIEADKSECKCLKESQLLLEIYAQGRIERADIKQAESATKVSAHREEQVEETHENTSINQTKQEGNVPSEESVTTSPPSLKVMETETVKTEHIAETMTVNMEIKETTASAEVFNQGSTKEADGLPSMEKTPKTTMTPESTESEPRFIRFESKNNIQATTESFSGLRMREDIRADATKLHEGLENDERAATDRRGDEGREEDQYDPKTTDDNMPLCGGLIHRTEAGWKHCVERFTGTRSEMFPSREQTDAFKDTEQREHPSIFEQKVSVLEDDEYDHFYYFDGVLKRVRNNFDPYDGRQRRRKRTENSAFTVRKKGDAHENLLSLIKRLSLRNKASHLE